MTRRKPPDRGSPPTDKRGRRSYSQNMRRLYASIHIGYGTVSSHPGRPVKEPELADRARGLAESGSSPEEIAGELNDVLGRDDIQTRQVRRWLE